jgi:geranylgeranyl transferase type-2 subunit beta
MGDEYGEIDTRFVFTAIQALSILGKLSNVNTEKTAEWIKKCQNFDGGFGLIPEAESHAAQGKFCVHGPLRLKY